MEYGEAIKYYGSDKPDLRFGMKFNDITSIAKEKVLRYLMTLR